jgi:hypothetical protein
MTTRLKGFTVMLDADIREDDAESIRHAILMIKRVQEVRPIETDSNDWMAYEKARRELREKLFEVLKP